MHAVALAARELANLLLLVAALKVERADISTRRHGAFAQLEHVEPARDFLPHGLAGIERIARLIDVADLHSLADTHRSSVRLLLANDHLEERCLSRSVGTNDADNATRRQI